MPKIKKVDLSMLTEIEQRMFDTSLVLTEGKTPVALYMRYSSDRQTEQSIEGQLRDCISYCERNEMRITSIYVDRATSASKNVEKRVNFQKMLSDSTKKQWERVLVWKLDRFARNREQSVIARAELRKHGIRVISATEAISDSPEGIILESLLDGLAEYYSAELSQKINRGLRESALKCNSTGGQIPLGYKIENHKLVTDDTTAPIVKEVYERFVEGHNLAEIARDLNARGMRTSRGSLFNKNSFHRLLTNERYKGIYLFKDIRVEGGLPRIISDELFEQAQQRLASRGHSPRHTTGDVIFHLSGILKCGECGDYFGGDSATGKNGKIYYYYTCSTKKNYKGNCGSKRYKKDMLESIIFQQAKELLTDEVIEEIADIVMEEINKANSENAELIALKARLADTESRLSNLMKAIEKGVDFDDVAVRVKELTLEKKQLTARIEEEKLGQIHLDRDLILFWLTKFKKEETALQTWKYRVINMFINSVTVYNDPDGVRLVTVYNLTGKQKTEYRANKEEIANFFESGHQNTTNTKVLEKFRVLIEEMVLISTTKHPTL